MELQKTTEALSPNGKDCAVALSVDQPLPLEQETALLYPQVYLGNGNFEPCPVQPHYVEGMAVNMPYGEAPVTADYPRFANNEMHVGCTLAMMELRNAGTEDAEMIFWATSRIPAEIEDVARMSGASLSVLLKTGQLRYVYPVEPQIQEDTLSNPMNQRQPMMIDEATYMLLNQIASVVQLGDYKRQRVKAQLFNQFRDTGERRPVVVKGTRFGIAPHNVEALLSQFDTRQPYYPGDYGLTD